jgi:hypothetical protein
MRAVCIVLARDARCRAVAARVGPRDQFEVFLFSKGNQCGLLFHVNEYTLKSCNKSFKRPKIAKPVSLDS